MHVESINWDQDFLRLLNVAVLLRTKQGVVTLHLLNRNTVYTKKARLTLSIRTAFYILLEIYSRKLICASQKSTILLFTFVIWQKFNSIYILFCANDIILSSLYCELLVFQIFFACCITWYIICFILLNIVIIHNF